MININKTIKDFFFTPPELNKIQRIIYTIWLFLSIFLALGLVTVVVEESKHLFPDYSSLWWSIIGFVTLTFIRNKLFQVWKTSVNQVSISKKQNINVVGDKLVEKKWVEDSWKPKDWNEAIRIAAEAAVEILEERQKVKQQKKEENDKKHS